MVFSSLLFLFRYLPVVFILYFILPKKLRNLLLFVASLIFYAWGEPVYVVIMLFSTVVDYTHGLLVERFLAKDNRKAARIVVASSMIINLSLLGFFKYTDFVLSNINALFGTDIALLNIALPIGISFYTFQTMSYTVDVYRGDAKAQHNIIDFGAYVALFPQLIAGPIVQYKTVAEELNNRRENIDDFADGVTRFMTGLGKKVLLANNAGIIWDAVSGGDLSSLPVLSAWIGILAYSFQIYFDFSGYSDMAIGLGRMLGFHFLENFNYPYLSKSITEFWRRWHISLGSWFRDYVYIPLGGNRQGFAKQIRNICVVWLLTGLWHGASWNFVLWGVYFGVLLIIEKLFLLNILKKLPAAVSHVYTLLLVIISWAIFAIDDMGRLGQFIGAMFGAGGSFADANSLYLLATNAILFVILAVAATPAPKLLAGKLMAKLGDKPGAIVQNAAFIGIFVLSVAYIVDASYNPFLYFRF
ncbi:MAG: MBOAT family protein [Clostridia bacterium]|nr:MBOAT family protein [Clostridia bacterium]